MAKNNVKYIGRDDLLSGAHFRCHELDVGGATLRFRELTAEEWLSLGKEEREAGKEAEEKKEDDPSFGLNIHFSRVSRLVCQTAVDENGKRIFQDGDEEMIRQRLGAETLMEVYKQLAQVAPPAEGGVAGGPSARTTN